MVVTIRKWLPHLNLYMVSIVKEKVENRVADPTKNNPYLTQKAEKKRDLCTCALAKNITYLTCKLVF
jgi:hypothetical protein